MIEKMVRHLIEHPSFFIGYWSGIALLLILVLFWDQVAALLFVVIPERVRESWSIIRGETVAEGRNSK